MLNDLLEIHLLYSPPSCILKMEESADEEHSQRSSEHYSTEQFHGGESNLSLFL